MRRKRYPTSAASRSGCGATQRSQNSSPWLREWNDALSGPAPKVGFYGLDLYSLHASMEAVIGYLDDVDPAAAERARER